MRWSLADAAPRDTGTTTSDPESSYPEGEREGREGERGKKRGERGKKRGRSETEVWGEAATGVLLTQAI